MAKAADKAAPKKAAATKAEPAKVETTKTAAAKKPAVKKTATKNTEMVIKTIIQTNGQEFDVTSVAAKALKEYKSVHKKKVVNEFVVYIKPEENVAYYTVNGEGQEDFKLPL